MALKIGDLWAQIRLEAKDYYAELDKASQKAEGFAGKLGTIGKTLTTRVSMPLAAAGTAAFAAASKQAAWAEELGNLNAQTGLSTTRLQELKYIADTSGLSFEGLTNTTGVLQRKLLGIEEGGGPAAAVMTELGVSITGADGQMRSMNDLFPELIAKLQQVENPTRRNALATQIFGRSALELAPLLGMTKEQMDKMTQAAHDSGKVMGEEVVGKLQTFDDAIDAITQKVQGFVTQAVAGFISLPGPIQGAILAIGGIAIVAGPIMQFIALLSMLKKAVGEANIAAKLAKLQFIQTWLAAAGPILPLIAAIAAVGLAVYAVIKYWKPIKAFFAKLWKSIYDATVRRLGRIFAAIKNFLSLPSKIAQGWGTLKTFFANLWKSIYDATVGRLGRIFAAIKNFLSLPSKIAQGWGTLKTFFANLWKAIYDATVGQLGRISAAIKNFLAHIFGLGGGSKAPAPPTPAAASAAASAKAGAKAGAGQPAVVRMSPDVEAAIKKTAANTKPQPRYA